ncbi:MAG: hypothetical protein GF307_10330 [candidate division Zixibacteria bacterium]|nr:hypothetical protein [candidate division Zixibacteria bacterium]
MLHRSQVEKILDGMIDGFNSDAGELILLEEEFNLSRFAESAIQQNVSRYNRQMMVRAVKGQKVGVAVSNQLDTDGILKAIRAAEEIAGNQKPDPKFPELEKYKTVEGSKDAYHGSTAAYEPGDRAAAIERCVDRAGDRNLECSGAYQTNVKTTAIASTKGTRQFFTETEGWLNLSLSGPGKVSGWAQKYSRDVRDIDAGDVAEDAIEKASQSSQKTELPPGDYTVILSPAAVADMILFLAFLGFGAKTMVTGRSFMSGKFGEKIASDKITITEDPYHPRINYMPFDYEGVPKKKVALVENGVAKGVVYNRYYAVQMDTESTGHALQPNNSYGPYPKSMVMDAGGTTVQEMIKSTRRGIYITHWWYINFLNPMKTMVTGTSQDGTLLIENGEVTSGVEDMRMGQSILEALSNVEAVSKEQELCPKFGTLMLMPTLKINNFTFIG